MSDQTQLQTMTRLELESAYLKAVEERDELAQQVARLRALAYKRNRIEHNYQSHLGLT